MRVEIYLSTEAAKSQFDSVIQHREAIQALLPEDVISWERLDDGVAARIAVYRDYDKGTATTDTPERRELFSWISSRLAILRAVAKQYVVEAPPTATRYLPLICLARSNRLRSADARALDRSRME
jgi:hypothetical protein